MNGLFGFILLIIGIISAASPQTAWYLSVGWKIKDAEPSDAALAMNRVGGVIACIVGLIILVSSCASMFTGGQDGKWERQFMGRIEAGEVSEIKFGLVDRTILTSEEMKEVTDMIQAAELEPFDPGNAWGASGTGTISFEDGYQVDLVLFGNSGGIELHPNETENAYRIQSSSLESWIRTNITNNY